MSCSRQQSDVQLSKSLSWILRHGAASMGLMLHEGGYVDLELILQLRNFKSKGLRHDDLLRVVSTDDKQRFSIRKLEDGKMQIRANQGHTMSGVSDKGLLTPIATIDDMPSQVIHGTFDNKWPIIKEQGLSRLKRNHIHFAAGLPGDDNVISGMRSNANVRIFIDAEAAMKDGFQFFRSENGVILCRGNEDGYLPAKYFKEVWTTKPRQKIFPCSAIS